MVSYNYDDIAKKTSDVYHLSEFNLNFDTLDRDRIIEKLKKLKHIHLIPEIKWKEIDTSMQKPLDIST